MASSIASCVPPSRREAGIPLPVAPAPRIRRSRAGVWRAAVLLGVHLLIAIHIALWLHFGTTMTPLEPSEAMEFSKRGIVNAGLIFFALAMASTLVLGRWFCGWACHLVALQDLARWLLGKVGVRPRPLRAGILGIVPLTAFLYMFVAPLVYRVLEGDPLGIRGHHYTTESFWATFPGWVPATLTFLVCGLLIIYFLGAKGFCTYGCPYGGIFGAVDQLAPLRIRVTDACEGCGHCTAVCSSNVRVHDEVRTWGMVVDPGCMKCLDCVQVCPKHALYVGWGRPAMAARRRDPAQDRGKPRRWAAWRRSELTDAPRPAPARGAARLAADPAPALRWVLRTVFVAACFVVFTGYDRSFAWTHADGIVSAVMTAATLALAWIFGGRSRRKLDYTLAEEALLAGFFLLAVLAFRGLYQMVAFLFALGLAAVIAWLALQFVLMCRRANLSLHGWRLRRAGRLEPAGVAFAAGMVALAGLWVHSGAIQHRTHRLNRLLAGLERGVPASPAERQVFIEQALADLGFLHRWSLVPGRRHDLRAARLHLLSGRPEQYEAQVRALLEEDPGNHLARWDLASWLVTRRRVDEAVALVRQGIALCPRAAESYVHAGLLLAGLGRLDEARQVYQEGLAVRPRSARLLLECGAVEAERGDLPAALEYFRRSVAADPSLVEARIALGRALCELGQTPAGLDHLRAALRQSPRNPEGHFRLGLVLARLGELPLARQHLEAAVRYGPSLIDAHVALATVYELQGDHAAAERVYAGLERMGRAP